MSSGHVHFIELVMPALVAGAKSLRILTGPKHKRRIDLSCTSLDPGLLCITVQIPISRIIPSNTNMPVEDRVAANTEGQRGEDNG